MMRENVCFIHARVGYSEGPQVPDPSAPEYQDEVEAHMGYWTDLMKSLQEKGKTVYVEPEHGPWPYQ
jgi:hypothetical protein